jgi:hypothetical protein
MRTIGLLIVFVLISFFCAEALFGEESALDEESATSEIISDEESPISETSISGEPGNVYEAPPIVVEEAPFGGNRSLDDVFPGLSRSQKDLIMSSTGLRHSFDKDDAPILRPSAGSGIDLLSAVMKTKPSHIIEALVLVPNNKKEFEMLDVYNALGRIKNIKDQTVPLNGRETPLFLETTRIESAKKRKAIFDPMPKDNLPFSETMYLRFKDRNIGDLYIRGDITIRLYGLTYSLTNFADVYYSIIRLMKAETFLAIIYLEPVKEGVLIYSMSGFYIPGFIASRVNLNPNIDRRLTVIMNWITDGLRVQESEWLIKQLRQN